MSLLTPESVPVTVYKWDDVGAPALDKTSGCVAAIIKACLVTGYASKVGAGWTLAREDLATKSWVFNVNTTLGDPLFLRLYNDDGKTMKVQLAKDVVDANTVTNVVDCDSAFNYLGANTTGEWMVIASDRAVWFFAQVKNGVKPVNRSGVFLFAGTVSGTSSNGFLIKHTGGTYNSSDTDRLGITATAASSAAATAGAGVTGSFASAAAACNLTTRETARGWLKTMWLGISNESPIALVAPLYFEGVGDIYQLPIYSPSRNDLNNFAVVDNTGGLNILNFCTSTQYKDTGNNAYIPTDLWSY